MFKPIQQKYCVKALQFLLFVFLVLLCFYLGYRVGENDFEKIIEILK